VASSDYPIVEANDPLALGNFCATIIAFRD
jgi:hypothetical protein